MFSCLDISPQRVSLFLSQFLKFWRQSENYGLVKFIPTTTTTAKKSIWFTLPNFKLCPGYMGKDMAKLIPTVILHHSCHCLLAFFLYNTAVRHLILRIKCHLATIVLASKVVAST